MKIKQFFGFAIVGASNTLISYCIYAILVLLHINYVVANIIGYIVSIFNAYYWNTKVVFKKEKGERRIWWKVLMKTFISYAGTGLILSNILLVIWVDGFNIHEMIAPIVNMLITVPLNYILNKYWAYKQET